MKKFSFLILSICCAVQVQAGEIYKWTDENGKVHFGDKTNAPKQSQEVVVKPVSGTGTMPSYNVKPLPVANSEQKKTETKEVDFASEEVMKCQRLAEQFVLKASKAERGAIGQQIRSLCPNWRFHCDTSRSQPEKNSCMATKENFGGALVKESQRR